MFQKKQLITLHTGNETILYIDLKKLEKNFNYFKHRISEETKIIAVVKAFAYGHGDVKIAKKLEQLGVYGFWVTDFEEGVVLRKSGIKEKIIIANPGIKSYPQIIKHNLDVVIYNHRLLDLYTLNKTRINIHVKLNTGMNRYGFDKKEIPSLARTLKENDHLNVLSICSHLASSEKKENRAFTLNQIEKFYLLASKVETLIERPLLKHILNSHGVINYPKHEMNLVRVGIGLYGSVKNKNLVPISKLTSVVTQTRTVSRGGVIGYGLSFTVRKKMKIAIVPVGYADGLNRKLSNGVGKVIINSTVCPIIGKISMGTFAVDTSKTSVSEGDKVEIFGENLSVLSIANSINTIPYEIFSTLNRRLKRIYSD